MVPFVTSYRARSYRGGAGAPQCEGERASANTRHVRRRRPPRMRGFRLDERGLLAAVLVGVALEALAGAVLAADAAVRAGGRLLASLAVLGDRARARHTVGARLRTSVVRVAETGVALEELLVARVVRGGERHLEADAIASRRRSRRLNGVAIRARVRVGSRGDGDVLDHKVREVLEEALQLLRVLVRRAVRRDGRDDRRRGGSGLSRVAKSEAADQFYLTFHDNYGGTWNTRPYDLGLRNAAQAGSSATTIVSSIPSNGASNEHTKELERLLEDLPNFVIEDITITAGSHTDASSDGDTVAPTAASTTCDGIRFQVTFTSPHNSGDQKLLECHSGLGDSDHAGAQPRSNGMARACTVTEHRKGSKESATCSNRGICGEDGTCECFEGYTDENCGQQSALV